MTAAAEPPPGQPLDPPSSVRGALKFLGIAADKKRVNFAPE
jgi:hypothetical protein